MQWHHRRGALPLEKPIIMGILNITPDSFSDGRRHVDASGNINLETAVRHALEMVFEGATIIDVGGESTRPGFTLISAEEETRRIVPVIEALRKNSPETVISVDTSKATVAEKALEAGADIVNDVQGLRDAGMVDVVRRYRAGAVIMHNGSVSGNQYPVISNQCSVIGQPPRPSGTPPLEGNSAQMIPLQRRGARRAGWLTASEEGCPFPHLHSPPEEGCPKGGVVDRLPITDYRLQTLAERVAQDLSERVRDVERIGIPKDTLCLDPGLGFGKRGEENWALLHGLKTIVDLGYPVLVGGSRKHFITDGNKVKGSVDFALEAIRQGAHIVRVHDVKETVKAVIDKQ